MPSSDPERALAARIVKDRLHAVLVATVAREYGFPVIDVDGTRDPESIYAQVEDLFAEVLYTSEPADLAAVRRWENENMLRNVRAWISSGEMPDAAELAFPFACECGRFGCPAQVSLTLREIEDPRQAVLAPAHRQ
jgi:hypothetical protein